MDNKAFVQLPPCCLYANWVGAKVLFYNRFDMAVVHNFFECSCDHGRDADASVVKILFGDVELW